MKTSLLLLAGTMLFAACSSGGDASWGAHRLRQGRVIRLLEVNDLPLPRWD